MKHTTETSLTLLDGLSNGDPDAWERMVIKYRPKIMGAFQKSGMQYDDADSYTQEILLELFKRFSNFKREKTGSFRAWINSIIKFRTIDYLRKLIRSPKLFPNEKFTNQAKYDDESNSKHQIDIQNIINLIRTEFSEREWKIFFLLTAEGMKPEEVSKELNVTKNIVYLTKSRMTKRIVKLFLELNEK